MRELGISEESLQNANESTRDAVVKDYARLKGLELIRTQGMFQKDHKDQRRRGKLREVELFEDAEMPEDENDINILGDNILLGDEAVKAFGKAKGGDQPPPAPTPLPAPAPGITPLKAALLAAGLTLGSAALGGLLVKAISAPAAVDTDTDTRTETDIRFGP